MIELSKVSKEENGLFSFARKYLAKEYREGIYVLKDTVIANYLYNDGCNLDSILKARRIRK
ncbi:hypothetical protein JCM10512_5062 [Bacteroides reticulotermitis JCM 10512]|uniref:Uncharacterized protein n=1 Tax=Bacteroides reticulotermitis JCM 10512 TaxID=1445607 RepID=W4V169_9BACE|nr:hypothetical protein JCM10512_5062 [Bacteroides reticulotermitis JCM 10512]